MKPTQFAKRTSPISNDDTTDVSNHLSNRLSSMNLVSKYRPISVPNSIQHRNIAPYSSHSSVKRRHQKRSHRAFSNMANDKSLDAVTPTNNVTPRFSQQPLPGQKLSDYLNTLPSVDDRFDLIITVLEETSKNFKKSQQRQSVSKAVEGIQERQLGAEFDVEFDAAVERMTDAQHGAEFDAHLDAAKRAAAQKTLDARKAHKAMKSLKARKTRNTMKTLEHMADAHLDAEMDSEIEHDLDLAEAAESMMLMGDWFGVDGFESFSTLAQEFEAHGDEHMTTAQEYNGEDQCMDYEGIGYDGMEYRPMEFIKVDEGDWDNVYQGNEIEFEMEGIRGL